MCWPPPSPPRPRARRLAALAMAALVLCLSAAPGRAVAGPVVEVTDAAGLDAALDRLEGGGTIVLRPGSYGDVVLHDRNPPAPLRLIAAPHAAPAVLRSLEARDVSNLELAGLTITRPLAPGEPSSLSTAALRLSHARDVILRGLRLTGSVDGDLANDGIGAAIADSQDIRFTGNTCHDLMRCAVFSRVERLTVRGNHAYTIRSDGLDFAGVRHALIEGNVLEAFPIQHGDPRHGGDHKDFIQFWTRATHPSRDVVIRDNILVEVGTETQGIFIRSETGAPHEDFLIENNIVYVSSWHGITVGGVHGAVVRGNTVIAEPDQRVVAGLNVHASRDVLLADNLVARVKVDESAGVRETGTRTLQWRSAEAPGFYDAVFANAHDVQGIADLRPRPDSLALRAGAARAFARLAEDAHISVAPLEPDDPADLGRRFTVTCPDAAPCADARWRFGDGAEATGATVTHTYAAPGRYTVQVVTGGRPALRRSVAVRTPLMLDLGFDGDLADASGRGHAVDWDGPARFDPDGAAGAAARFRAADKGAIVVRPGAPFSGQAALTVAFDLRVDAPGDARLVWLHESFGLEIARGDLIVHVFDAEGRHERLLAPLPAAADGRWRAVLFQFDGAAGTARLMLDGRTVDSLRGLAPRLKAVGGRDLTIGGIHGRFLTGAIDRLRIAAAAVDGPTLDALSRRLDTQAAATQ